MKHKTAEAHGPQEDQPPSHSLAFMHRPPNILPNYGKLARPGVRLKTNLPRVLLYDNVTQQSLLDARMSGIASEHDKTRRQLDMNLKAFLLRNEHKNRVLAKLTHVHHPEDAQPSLEPCLPARFNHRRKSFPPTTTNSQKTDQNQTTNFDLNKVNKSSSSHSEPQPAELASLHQQDKLNDNLLPPLPHLNHAGQQLSLQPHVSSRPGHSQTEELTTTGRSSHPVNPARCVSFGKLDAILPQQPGSEWLKSLRCPEESKGDHRCGPQHQSKSVCLPLSSGRIKKEIESSAMNKNPVFDVRFERLQNVLVKSIPPDELMCKTAPSSKYKTFKYDYNNTRNT